MTRRAARGLAALGLALAAGPARAQPGPPCLTQVHLSGTSAVVGQQIVYAVRVLRRPDVSGADWIVPPAFPSFRAEWLPGRPGDTRVWQGGTPYLVYEERHAIFPLRAGHLALPGARLLCELHAFAGEERKGVEVELGGAVVEVTEPPREGRPASFTGLVGRVSVRRELDPPRIRLGETIRLRVVLEGSANLWDAPAPPLEGLEQADLFAHAPELALDAAERLHARRTFVWDVVPRRTGPLALPGFEMASFDPEASRYETLRIPPLAAEVEPAAARPALPAAPPSAAPARSHWRGPALALLAGVALAVAVLVWLERRRRQRADTRDVERALEEADAARARGAREAEGAALARALRAALALQLPGARTRAPEELVAAAPDGAARAALALLAALEAARFAPEGAAPDAVAIRRAARDLLRGAVATRRD